jgi:hypothetical protein
MAMRARLEKVVTPDDKVAEDGYYTIPPIQTVASTGSVPNFVVARKGYGSISFKAPVDLTGISSLSVLREIVEIVRGHVSVYPNESKESPAATGLNVAAEVSLENVRPPNDIALDEYTEQLRSKRDTKFISYNPASGLWVFSVEHFSTYGISDSRYSSLATERFSPSTNQRGSPNISRMAPTASSARATLTSTSDVPRRSSRINAKISSTQYSRSVSMSSISIATPSTESAPGTDNELLGPDYLDRVSKARRMFRKLAKSYLEQRKPPPEDEVAELWQYSDVIDYRKLLLWRDEVGIKKGVLYDTGKVMFDQFTSPPHDEVCDLFHLDFATQFVTPWVPPFQSAPFKGWGTQGKKLLH